MEQEKQKGKEKRTVLDPRQGGGPHGLGDPDDHHMRIMERDIIIPKRIRTICRNYFCTGESEVFMACGSKAGLMLPVSCRKESKALRDCMVACFERPEIEKRAREEYLNDQSEFRRTGIRKDERQKIQLQKLENKKKQNDT